MSQGRSHGTRRRTNHNDRSVYGAYPARRSELRGYESPIALLQALDVFQLLRKRPQIGVFAEKFGDGFGSHGSVRGDTVNIILVSDSLAKSRSVALSQTQVLLIAFGILVSGFLLAMATYMVTMKFAVDLRNPYLRSLQLILVQGIPSLFSGR